MSDSGGPGDDTHVEGEITLRWRADRILEHLKTLVEQSNESSRDSARAFYQAMISLSAGAIVVSVTFAEKIAPPPREATELLVISWALFTFSLLSILVAFRQLGNERAAADVRMNVWVYKICFGDLEGDTIEKSLGPPFEPPRPILSKILVAASIASFGLGVSVLTWFAGANLK